MLDAASGVDLGAEEPAEPLMRECQANGSPGRRRLRGYHDADGVECVEIIVEAFHDTTAT